MKSSSCPSPARQSPEARPRPVHRVETHNPGAPRRSTKDTAEPVAFCSVSRQRSPFSQAYLNFFATLAPGRGPFVEALQQAVAQTGPAWPPAHPTAALPALMAAVAAQCDLPPAALIGGPRRRPIPAARAALGCLARTHLGLPAATVARRFSVSLPAVLQAVGRGQATLGTRQRSRRCFIACGGLARPLPARDPADQGC